MKKLTAVELLVKAFSKHFGAGWLNDVTIKKEIEQANKLFEKQIVDAYVECWMQDGGNGNHKTKEAEDYYNETFNQVES